MINLLFAILLFTAPLVLAAMGGLLSERSGVMNIALEGKMLTAACITATIAGTTGNAWLGLLCGILAAILVSMLHAVLTQVYRFDHIVSGMAINTLAFGLTKTIHAKITPSQIPALPISFYLVLAFVAPIVLALLLNRTAPGLRLLAVGYDPAKAREAGVNPVPVRCMAMVGTGLLCGLGGALIVTDAGLFGDGITAGKGYVALAALILGSWKPMPVLLACLGFGTVTALQLQFQGGSLGLPSEIWNAMPYLATLIALAALGIRQHAPRGLGKL